MEQIRKNVFQIILIRNLFGDSDMIINQSYANHKNPILFVIMMLFIQRN